MPAVVVNLPDDLAAFVAQAVTDGRFDSADELFAYAVGRVRTDSALGGQMAPETPPEVVRSATPTPSRIPATAVDLTRHTFDSPNFMAELVDKIGKRASNPK
jgi:Arc/MetJ-type ribon-helix-helix transcriptional regulator